LLTNTTFLSSLEERQRSCRLYIDTIGDILDKDLVNMINYEVRLPFRPFRVKQLRWSDSGLLCQSGKRSRSVAIGKRQKRGSCRSFAGMLSWSLSRTNQRWAKAKLMDRSDCVRNPLYATSTFPVICSCLVRLRGPIWGIR
jgi:hypothetical protein